MKIKSRGVEYEMTPREFIEISELTYQEQWELISTLRHFKIEEVKVGNDNKIRVVLVSDEK